MNFAELYSNLFLPILVCRAAEGLPAVYLNVRATLLFAPTDSVDARGGQVERDTPLREILNFRSEAEYDAFCQIMKNFGHVDDYLTEVETFDGRALTVRISAKLVEAEENYLVLYLSEQTQSEGAVDYDSGIISIINSSFLAEDVDSSIQMILSLAGKWVDVSRVYVFEEISAATTRNTYEWCNEGVKPAIQDLQNLAKAEYPYDDIVAAGMFIAGDVSQLPEGDRAVLEPQGIVSLAIIPFYDAQTPLGYVGFDDCEKKRQWSHDEIQFLKSISILLANLVKRRNAERDARRSQAVLQIISDTSEELIYANALDDYTVKFVNSALSKVLGKPPEELLGQKCYKVLQAGQTGPCAFCPVGKIEFNPDEDRSEAYEWEQLNTVTNRSYLNRGRIVKWVDGTYVHVETATDITERREYEERLRRLASTDSMTGVHNREWGGQLLAELLESPYGKGSLCFLDVDGLKYTNDTLGHDAGDALLVETVRAIKGHLASDDIICRWGGDEFLLWLGCSQQEAERVIAAILQEMEQFNRREGKPYKLSFSYGITEFKPGSGDTLDSIVTRADGLMYKHKMEKRGIALNRRRTDKV